MHAPSDPPLTFRRPQPTPIALLLVPTCRRLNRHSTHYVDQGSPGGGRSGWSRQACMAHTSAALAYILHCYPHLACPTMPLLTLWPRGRGSEGRSRTCPPKTASTSTAKHSTILTLWPRGSRSEGRSKRGGTQPGGQSTPRRKRWNSRSADLRGHVHAISWDVGKVQEESMPTHAHAPGHALQASMLPL